ncbi:MAG: hypothetical protein WCO57_04700 [Verrucomicrobiota bacterium]
MLADSMCRLDLGEPGLLPALNTGLEAWGEAGVIRYTENTGISMPIEIVTDGDWKWAEVGFISPEILQGNAMIGWIYPPTRCRTWMERNDTLVIANFQTTGFVDATGYPIPVLGGFAYAVRSIYPVDAKVKTAALTAGFTSGGDTRNNPITALTIADVVQSLPNFPYTMPGSAAQLQADLRAAGWTGATVTASSATVWSIVIPNVPLTDWNMLNKVYWPEYAFTDALGNAITSDGQSFAGTYVDSFNVPIKPKQFIRMGVRKL